MDRTELAVERFASGYSCAQAVLSVFARQLGLPEEMAYKLAAGFGGGMAHLDGPCGAVTGGLMVLGMARFDPGADVRIAKSHVYTKAAEFVRMFTSHHGSILCSRLLGCNLSRPEELRRAVEEGVIGETCPRYLRDAVALLESLLGG